MTNASQIYPLQYTMETAAVQVEDDNAKYHLVTDAATQMNMTLSCPHNML